MPSLRCSMDKNEYFRLMRETSDITDQIILESIDQRYTGSLHELVVQLPRKRARSGRPKLRPAMFRFSYELAGGEDWTQFVHLASAVEMMNLSTYVLNYVLDEKGGDKPKHQRNNECMASMILRELAQHMLLDNVAELGFDTFVDIDRRMSEINRWTSGFGQFLDGNSLGRADDQFDDDYVLRCEGLTGRFMQYVCEIGALAAGSPVKYVYHLGRFGKAYGIVVQILNDVGDFMPPDIARHSVGKVHQDQYADIKHGCLTFPSYVVLTEGNSEERATVLRVQEDADASLADCIAVSRAFMRLDGVSRTKEYLKSHALQAAEALICFPKSEARDFLTTALSVWRNNKVYRALQEVM